MLKYSWKLNAGILGLSVASITIGISALNANKGPNADIVETRRRLMETGALALAATHFTKSWWPLALPLGYIAFDQAWAQYYNKAPMIGAR